MTVKLEKQDNISGDASLANQGFGRLSATQPPAFDPASDRAAACSHFEQNGYVVLSACLDASEIGHGHCLARHE